MATQEQATWERAGDKSYWTQEDAERQLPGWRHQFPDAEFRARETIESGWVIEYQWHGAE